MSTPNVQHVLIAGFLDQDMAQGIVNTIKGKERVCLLIHSDGGSIDATLSVIETLKHVRDSTAVVYDAKSSSATIALFCKNRKITNNEASFHLHTGRFGFEACNLVDDQIPTKLLQSVKDYQKYLFKRLEDLGFKDPKKIDQLRTGGWLKMSAEKWVESGLLEWG
jgi:ATP-dependent protease ClpP protease subunit